MPVFISEEESPSDMAGSNSNFVTWDEIELSESYLVCGMFEEAEVLAASIMRRIHENSLYRTFSDILLSDMMTSAAMVLVQSRRESGRTSGLLNELNSYFGSATAIPVQVVLTGACVQVSGGHTSEVRSFLEDFLAKWELDNDKYHIISHNDVEKNEVQLYGNYSTLEVGEYLEVVEFYALTLLGGVLNNLDHAVSWVEKAQLPPEAQQDLLRRLSSLSHRNSTSSQQDAVSSSMDEPESRPLSVKEVKQSDKPMIVLGNQCNDSGSDMQLSVWKWLQTITKRSYNTVKTSKWKILLGCLIFVVFHFIRKKGYSITRIIQRRTSSLKKALLDLWHLAFSYQVNPLAAVQSLPPPANRS